MKLFDLIYDNDALIEGLIVAKQGDNFRVLWNNGIIGDVKEEYKEIEVLRHLNIIPYEIIDILHTGHHGPEGQSKVGAKYDRRRGKVAFVNVENFVPGNGLVLHLFDKEDYENLSNLVVLTTNALYTTVFENFYESEGFSYLKTMNSLYKLKRLDWLQLPR